MQSMYLQSKFIASDMRQPGLDNYSSVIENTDSFFLRSPRYQNFRCCLSEIQIVSGREGPSAPKPLDSLLALIGFCVVSCDDDAVI